jgi:hypothetical protein
MLTLGHRTAKQLAAAFKLAAVYAAGVTVVLLALILTGDGARRHVLEILPVLAIPAGVCLGIAFLLLAVARRAGFTALWVVIFGMWIAAVTWHFDPAPANVGFALWTLLAAPLYAIVVLGFRYPSSSARSAIWRRSISMAIAPAWLVLYAAAIHFVPSSIEDFASQPPRAPWLWRSLWLAWMLSPPTLTVAAVLRLYRGTPADVPRAA